LFVDCRMVPNPRMESTSYWGGLVSSNASPALIRCEITGHRSIYAPVFSLDSTIDLQNTLVAGNQAYYNSTAFYAERSTLRLSNCTVTENRYPMSSGESSTAIYALDTRVSVLNSILWDTTQSEVQAAGNTSISIDYSDLRKGAQAVAGPWTGRGNIAVDPCFVQVGGWRGPAGFYTDLWVEGDYHLSSQAWQTTGNPADGAALRRGERTSLCLEAGSPGTPLADEPVTVDADPSGLVGRNVRVEMGAYGGTGQAGIAPSDWGLLADLNNDGVVEGIDLALFGMDFGRTTPGCPADLDRSGAVRGADLAMLCQEWLSRAPWLGMMVVATPPR
jgi:hypothetical protein